MRLAHVLPPSLQEAYTFMDTTPGGVTYVRRVEPAATTTVTTVDDDHVGRGVAKRSGDAAWALEAERRHAEGA